MIGLIKDFLFVGYDPTNMLGVLRLRCVLLIQYQCKLTKFPPTNYSLSPKSVTMEPISLLSNRYQC